MNRPRALRAFTIVELILVMLIMVLLAIMAAPNFSRMQKSTRVDEAAKVVISACNKARAEAQRYRTVVAVHFGDDTTGLATKPKPGILPPYGQIEISSMNLGYNDGVGWLSFRPFSVELGYWNSPNWYPHVSKFKVLTPEPLKFNPGVRIITGYFRRSGNDALFGFPKYKNNGGWEGPVGEIKRHCTAYDKRGGSCGYDQNNNYYYILVFDVVTGEHRVIQAGVTQAASRPRIMNDANGAPIRLTHIRMPSGTNQPLTDPRQLGKIIDTYPNAEWMNPF